MKQMPKLGDSIVGDLVAVVPGWLALAMIEPFTATVTGLPAAAALTAMRRTWWADQPLSGFIVSFVLMPVLTLLGILFGAFGLSGLAPGAALAALAIGAIEIRSRRRGRSLVRRFPLATAGLFLLLLLMSSTLLLEMGLTRYPTEEFVEKLSTPAAPPNWSHRARVQAVRVVERIANGDRDRNPLLRQAPDLAAEKSPDGVYVTLYEESGYRARGHGNGGSNALDDLISASLDAVKQPLSKPRAGGSAQPRWEEAAARARIQIDVPGPRQRIAYRPFYHSFAEPLRSIDSGLKKLEPIGALLNLAFEIEPGVDGLVMRQSDGGEEAVMLPAEPVTQGWLTPRVRTAPAKLRQMMRRTWRERHGSYPNLERERFTVWKFRTASFGRPGPGQAVVDWFRGNLLIGETLPRALLVERTAEAADWLSRQVIDDPEKGEIGRFHYEIYPPYKAATGAYNLPRHAGSIYGLFAFYRASVDEPRFQEAGVRALRAGLAALDYVQGRLGSPDPDSAPDLLCFLDEDRGASSGSTALAAMSVAELPGPEAVRDPDLRSRVGSVPVKSWLEKMGNCLLVMIDAHGAVFREYAEAKALDRVEKEPLYFPGEVMLALVRTYARLGDRRYLEGATRIADRQMRRYRVYLSFDWPYPGDHWIIQALSQLAAVTGEKKYAELAVLMGRGYLREQYPPQEYLYPDYRGAYRRVLDIPRTTRAASRGEALGGAWEAARLLGSDTAIFETALLEGAGHLIAQQFVKGNSHFVPSDQDVLGGIRMGLVDNHLRIDNNQHALVALLRALAARDTSEGVGFGQDPASEPASGPGPASMSVPPSTGAGGK